MPTIAEPAAGKQALRPGLILAICCMSLLLVGMDATIVNVALPSIQHDLRASLPDLQWIVDAYTLVVASLLMLAGSISDRVGRKRTFMTGIAVFTTGSVLCSTASGIGTLVASRALQGLGASMLNPVALSIIANAYSERKARARALGIWGATGGLAFGVGPLLGGFLTQSLGWRSIFWVNLPVGLLAATLAALFIPESKAARARAFDPLGQVLVFTVLAAATYGVIEGPRAGWHSAPILGLFALAAAGLVFFLVYEPRCKEPLLDLRFFRSVPFTSATLLAVCSFASFGGFLFLNALYLQQVRGYSAFHTGLCTLPLAAAVMGCSPLSGRLVAAYGTRPSLLTAGAGFLFSSLLLTRLDAHTPLGLLLIAYALFGLGVGMINPPIAASAVAGMPLSQAGVAAAVASTSRQVGAAFGVAIAGTIVAESRKAGVSFVHATHPIWWLMTVAGGAIAFLGWLSTTAWAQATAERSAASFESA